ncbi:MAG: UDP-N-acetylmuramate dehydrogenase [Burkholderiaceae bacterium]|nr:MAG: UDP-N-acetylmuramate dehydrogenase [Burkholderiaceae bacterium]
MPNYINMQPLAHHSLQSLNTLGVPAHAAWYLAVDSVDTLKAGLARAEREGLPWLVLGGGSNLVLTRDYPGLVLHMALRGRSLVDETESHYYITAQAGENWHELVQWTLEQGWPGLENLALIPGTVGAAPIQNIGAYGLELAERLVYLEAFDTQTRQVVRLDKSVCGFGYRDSIFKRQPQRYIILNVTLALPKAWQPVVTYRDLAESLAAQGIGTPTAAQIFDAVVAVRQRKLPDPARLGNVGSFFKNPIVSAVQQQALLARFPQLVSYPQADGAYKLAAAWLIDQCGWKGKSLGRARVHDQQALVLVNPGQATGADILQLAQAIQRDVQARFGVMLEPEPHIL